MHQDRQLAGGKVKSENNKSALLSGNVINDIWDFLHGIFSPGDVLGRAFLGLVVLNILAFGTYLSDPLFSPDDLYVLAPHGLIWQRDFPSERPVADMVFPFLFSGAIAPFLQLSIFIFANVVSALWLAVHWRLERTRDFILVGALVTTSPAWADQYTFLANTVRFIPLAFPLAIVSYLLALRPSFLARVTAFILTTLMIGLYQLGANSYIMLGIIDAILITISYSANDARRYIRIHLFPAVIILLLSVFLFIMYLKGIHPSGMERTNLSLTPVDSMAEVKSKLSMYARVADALFFGAFVGLFSYGWMVAIALVFLGSAAGIVYVFRSFPVSEAFLRLLVFFCLEMLLFSAILASQSFNVYNSIFLRVLVGAGLFFACSYLLIIRAKEFWSFGYRVGLFLTCLLCYIFITTDGYIHAVGKMSDQADLLISSRMAAQIENDKQSGEPLALVVIGASHPFFGFRDLHEKQVLFYRSRPWLDATVSSFAALWAKRPIFRLTGFEFIEPTQQQIFTACEYSRTMPAWPAKGSILVGDGISVVKLSEPLPADGCR
jgi:hypothetical protein